MVAPSGTRFFHIVRASFGRNFGASATKAARNGTHEAFYGGAAAANLSHTRSSEGDWQMKTVLLAATLGMLTAAPFAAYADKEVAQSNKPTLCQPDASDSYFMAPIADAFLAAAYAARRMAAELDRRAIVVPGPTALLALAAEFVAAADQRILAAMPPAGNG
jgi:hypothetical protein